MQRFKQTATIDAPAALWASEPRQVRKEAALRIARRCRGLGRVAQRESTRFTREGSLVRSQPRPFSAEAPRGKRIVSQAAQARSAVAALRWSPPCWARTRAFDLTASRCK